jgi:hypothetical protein
VIRGSVIGLQLTQIAVLPAREHAFETRISLEACVIRGGIIELHSLKVWYCH